MRLLAAVALACAFLLPGCLDRIHEADLLVLEYTLVADGDGEGSEERIASPGPHCATAGLEGSRAWMEGKLGAGEGVIVQPRLSGGWVTTGEETYAKALPARIYTDLSHANDAVPWTTVDGDHRGGRWSVTVDGAEVPLPHNWTVQGDGWHVEARLSEGPHSYRSVKSQPCM